MQIGDYVSRNSYNNDTIFKIVDIKNDVAILKGVDIRLFADSNIDDLEKCDYVNKDEELIDSIMIRKDLDRSEYFYLPAKILQIDGDKSYLDKCLEFYKKNKIMAFGKVLKEEDMSKYIYKYLEEIKPDVLVITGHDAFNRKNGDESDLNNYKNP